MIPFAVVACFTAGQRSGVSTDIPDTDIPDTDIPDTDIPDTDIPDTDADCTAVDTLDVYETWSSDGAVLAGTYTGTETYAAFEVGAGNAALCSVMWTMGTPPDPTMPPCEDCEWTIRVARSEPTLATTPGFDCTPFEDIAAEDPDEEGFGYGFGMYNYQGTDYPALWFLNDDAGTWAPAALLPGVLTPDAFSYEMLVREYTVETPAASCAP